LEIIFCTDADIQCKVCCWSSWFSADFYCKGMENLVVWWEKILLIDKVVVISVLILSCHLSLDFTTGLFHLHLTYLLTPWNTVLLEKLTSFQLVKKFPAYYVTSKVHYHIHKCLPPVPILSQLDPVHTPTSHLLMIHLNIILPSMPGSPKWSLTFRFPHQNPVYATPLLNVCYMPRSFHSSGFFHSNNFGWGVQFIKLHIMYFSLLPCYLFPLSSKYSPQQPILKHPQPTFLPQYERPSFTPLQNNRQNYSSVYLNL